MSAARYRLTVAGENLLKNRAAAAKGRTAAAMKPTSSAARTRVDTKVSKADRDVGGTTTKTAPDERGFYRIKNRAIETVKNAPSKGGRANVRGARAENREEAAAVLYRAIERRAGQADWQTYRITFKRGRVFEVRAASLFHAQLAAYTIPGFEAFTVEVAR